jgi:hypothetical protein
MVWGHRIYEDMREFDAADPEAFLAAWKWLHGVT